MRSSFDAFHDETQPRRLLDELPDLKQRRDGVFLGAVMTMLAVVVPVLALLAL